MDALIVYESLYGNTREIAEAIADGLRDEGAEVGVVAVADATAELTATAGLLVLGGPTHMHGMASDRSRNAAAANAEKHRTPAPDVEAQPMRDWFEVIGTGDGRVAAAFDTRLAKPKLLTGSAAHGIADRLRRHRYDVVAEESFLVDHSEGPLHPGELPRARAWGRVLMTHKRATGRTG